MRSIISVVVLVGVAAVAFLLGSQWDTFAPNLFDQTPATTEEVATPDETETAGDDAAPAQDMSGAVDGIAGMPGIEDVPGKPGASSVDASSAGYVGTDTCQWANDGECDDPGIGTGACEEFTDYSDCRRIALGIEDNSCQWANDGECDEPHLGTGACTQATDYNDCQAVVHLRFQDDTCATAFNGVCEEPGTGDGSCEAGTDRGDCLGRDRPMQISDHFFGHDDRQFMDTSTMPWAVIGTVSDEAGGACTATLVGEDILITAAHCIEYDGREDATGTFETAFDRPGGSVTAQVIDYYVSPNRRADRTQNEEAAGTDWALLRLDQPIGRELGYLGVRALVNDLGEQGAIGTALYQAGYSYDTGDHLSGNMDCQVVDIEDQNRFAHNCDTTQGDSGSPIMIREGDNYFVIGSDSTYRFLPDAPAVNIATRSEDWIDLLPDFAAGRIGNGGVRPAPAVKPGATPAGGN